MKVETYKVVPPNRGAMRTREGPTVNLNELIESGHFPKKYDPSRRIPNDVVDNLLKFIYSIPTSVNAQSTHYLVASTPESRSRIADHMGEGFDFNVPKVRDASHIIVLATRETLSNEYLDELHAKEVADGKFPTEALADKMAGHRADVDRSAPLRRKGPAALDGKTNLSRAWHELDGCRRVGDQRESP